MSGILNSKVNIWMTDNRLLKYQSLLLERPVTKLKVCGNLNPATFLPEKENETPDHDCSHFLTLNYAGYWMLGASALGRPRGMVWGGRREEGSGWGTHVYLWRIHFDIWEN